jgi:phage-related protein
MLIDEYLVKLGVVGDTKQADEYKQSLLSVAKGAAGAVAAITAAFAALSGYFANALSDLAELSVQAQEANVSVAFLQNLGYAAMQSNSSIEAARASIQGLNRVMGEAQNGVGRGAKAFEKFGIAVKDSHGQALDMGQVLGQIQAKLQTMSRPQQIAMLSRLGIDPSMRQLLTSTSDELEKLFNRSREWGTFTDEQADAANSLGDQFHDLQYGVGQFRTMIAVSLVPAMSELLTKFKEWFSANRELIGQGLTRLFSILQAGVGVIWNVADFFNRVIEGTVGWSAALKILAGVWLLLNASMLANPITWITAGVIALALAIDDLMTYMKGGESVLGDFWRPVIEWGGQAMAGIREWWTTLAPIFSQIADAIGPLMTALAPVIEFIASLVGGLLVEAWRMFGEFVKFTLQSVLALIQLVTAALTGDWGAAIDVIKGYFGSLWDFVQNIFGNILNLGTNVAKKVGGFFSGLFGGKSITQAAGDAANAVTSAQAAATPAAQGGQGAQAALPAPAAPATGTAATGAPGAGGQRPGNTTVSNSGNVTVTQTINTTDPERAGQIAAQSIEENARRATANTLPAVVQ